MSRLVIAIDGDSAVLDLMEEVLDTEGFTMRRGCPHHLNVEDIQRNRPRFMIVEIEPFAANDTIDFLVQLRACLATKPIPVIVESTDRRLLETLAEPMLHLGCIALEKPFELDQLFAAIGQADRLHKLNCLVEPSV